MSLMGQEQDILRTNADGSLYPSMRTLIGIGAELSLNAVS
jgi:hypothetical protein